MSGLKKKVYTLDIQKSDLPDTEIGLRIYTFFWELEN